MAASATFGRRYLWDRLNDDGDDFVVSPLPDRKRAIGHGTIDLRVGDLFLSASLSSVPAVDASELREGPRLFQELRVRAKPDAFFIMQPRQFVLASTLEYISMPMDLCGLIQSRSTFGRMGLIAATAAYVGPGYKGSPTLELVNAGEVALKIEPYSEICQLIVMSADETDFAPSRYQGLTRPTFVRPELGED